MQDDIRAPTLAHDLGAIAGLYVDVVRLMARRMTHRSTERAKFYPPVLVVRPGDGDEPEDMVQAAERLNRKS